MIRIPPHALAAVLACMLAPAAAQPVPPSLAPAPPIAPAPPAPPPSRDESCLREGGHVACRVIHRDVERRPRIGVVLAPDARGVRIAAVTPSGPAADAGLATGDRILSIGGGVLDGGDNDARLEQARAHLAGAAAGRTLALRVERNGKARTVEVTPRGGLAPLAWNGGDGQREVVVMRRGGDGDIEADALHGIADLPPDALRVIRELRSAPGCKGADCPTPMVLEAFRWNGLNLASVDTRLGRYFGTDRGVLVLGAGDVLSPLEPGDVILNIDGRAVDTPREAMDAMRGKPADSRMRIDYLRDRGTRTAQVLVPRTPRWDAIAPLAPLPPSPPAPSAPPAPPGPPSAPPSAPTTAPAAPHAPPRG